MNKLGSVFRFETMRALKKSSFWIVAILMPLLLVGYFGVVGLAGSSMGEAIENGVGGEEVLVYGLVDEAGLLENLSGGELYESFSHYDDFDKGFLAFKNGDVDVLYRVPVDFAESAEIGLWAKADKSKLFTNYEAPMRSLLSMASAVRVAPEDVTILTNGYAVDATMLDSDGNEVNLLSKMIIPGVALAIFYILIVLFGNRLMMAVVEEKENRIAEMLLTSVRADTLILGKILSLIVLGLLQVVLLLVPMIIFYLYSSASGDGSIIDLSAIVIDWDIWAVLGSLALLLSSYFLFVGMCVTVGVLVPTARDASNYAGVVMIAVVLPILFLGSFIAEPNIAVYILSYFPPSAPAALMLRNLFGTLPSWELVLGIVVILVASYIVIWFAVRTFKMQALNLSKVSLKSLFGKNK